MNGTNIFVAPSCTLVPTTCFSIYVDFVNYSTYQMIDKLFLIDKLSIIFNLSIDKLNKSFFVSFSDLIIDNKIHRNFLEQIITGTWSNKTLCRLFARVRLSNFSLTYSFETKLLRPESLKIVDPPPCSTRRHAWELRFGLSKRVLRRLNRPCVFL